MKSGISNRLVMRALRLPDLQRAILDMQEDVLALIDDESPSLGQAGMHQLAKWFGHLCVWNNLDCIRHCVFLH